MVGRTTGRVVGVRVARRTVLRAAPVAALAALAGHPPAAAAATGPAGPDGTGAGAAPVGGPSAGTGATSAPKERRK
ncbi:hypothetical protein AB0G57_16815, partial [Streptomyces lavendulae]